MLYQAIKCSVGEPNALVGVEFSNVLRNCRDCRCNGLSTDPFVAASYVNGRYCFSSQEVNASVCAICCTYVEL